MEDKSTRNVEHKNVPEKLIERVLERANDNG